MNCLTTWNIQPEQQFYPIGISSIGENTNLVITTYAAHTVNTFIFRNFTEHIRNDRPPHKCFLHKTLFPDRIKEIALGSKESAILLENGTVMYFKSPKKLVTVEYLSDVKSICSSKNGFVSICTSPQGNQFFIEFHSDVFQINESQLAQRKRFEIPLNSLTELQNTWNQSRVKIKELCFDNGRKFLHKILSHDIDVINENNDTCLFLSIDKSFCSIHVLNDELCVNPIVKFNTEILDFWSFDNYILVLLENGCLEIIHSHGGESGVSKKSLYIGYEGVLAYHFHEGMFIYSNGACLEYGLIELFNDDTLRFQRKSINLPGIAAAMYLPQFELILCVNENCQYYYVAMQTDMDKRKPGWIEIDDKMQKRLTSVRLKLIELADNYGSIVDEQTQQKRILNVIQMKRYDGIIDDEINCRFVAACSVMTQNLPHYYDSSKNMIYVANSMAYDRETSFFVAITISNSVRYANEFDTKLWSLCCRWLNDKQENVYANIKLVKGQLSNTVPLKVIIHFQQSHLPSFQLELSSMLDFNNFNNPSRHIFNFPVHVDQQPNYCDIVNPCVSTLNDRKCLVCTLSMPKSIPIVDLLQKFEKKNQPHVYNAHLLGKFLTAVYCPEAQTLRLFSKNANVMHFFKIMLLQSIHENLSNQGYGYVVKIPNDSLKAYFVSKQTSH